MMNLNWNSLVTYVPVHRPVEYVKYHEKSPKMLPAFYFKIYIKKEIHLQSPVPRPEMTATDERQAFKFLTEVAGMDVLDLRYIGSRNPIAHIFEAFILQGQNYE
jgi:hypothetical protein